MLKLIFWDVQHGHACYFSTPANKRFVIDLGTGSYTSRGRTFSPLNYLRTQWGTEQLDGVILTHPHRDHLDDIFEFDAMHPRVLIRPKHLTEEDIRSGNYDGGGGVIDKYLEINHDYNQPVTYDPFIAQNNGGVQIHRFFPRNCSRSSLNNHSVVTVVSYANSKVIIPGDNEEPSWKELLTDNSFCLAINDADLLLASHHGRKAGYCADIFQYFKPRLTIISDGPEGETSVTDRYSRVSRGWKVFRREGREPYNDKKCVTTRSNGVVEVNIGWNESSKPFLQVTVD